MVDGAPGGFRRDDRVQVWSESSRAWLEGRIVEVLAEQATTEEGHLVPAGTVRVATARSLMLVPPGKVSEVLRPVSDEAALVAVISPGAGVKANKAVYSDLKRDARFRIQVLGARGESYDRYPECWDGGSAPPNLESFAGDLLAEGTVSAADCIVAGSRGGQVVLPAIWRVLGTSSPPAVVVNGGCAMTLPGPAVVWPVNAVTILILGGEDYFRAGVHSLDYIANTRRLVPKGNASTAIFYIREMEHMPQTSMLKLLMAPSLLAAIYWRVSGRAPAFELRSIAKDLEAKGWNGQLSFLDGSGGWAEVPFGPTGLEPASPTKAKTNRSAKTPSEIAAEQEEEKAKRLQGNIADKERELQLLRQQLAECQERARCLRQTAGVERAAASRSGQAPGQHSGGYSKGQRVHYWSVTQSGWLECEVIATRASDGAIQVSVKPDFWIKGDEQAQRIRPITSASTPGPPPGGGAGGAAYPAAPQQAPSAASAPAAAAGQPRQWVNQQPGHVGRSISGGPSVDGRGRTSATLPVGAVPATAAPGVSAGGLQRARTAGFQPPHSAAVTAGAPMASPAGSPLGAISPKIVGGVVAAPQVQFPAAVLR